MGAAGTCVRLQRVGLAGVRESRGLYLQYAIQGESL